MKLITLFLVVISFLLTLITPITVRASIIDTLSGLTPGDTIGGSVTPQGGGPAVPLASDVVDAMGNVSFIKPNFEIGMINYINDTTGMDIMKVTTSDGSAINSFLDEGDSYPFFEPPAMMGFFDVFVEIDLFDDLLDLDSGIIFPFLDGSNNALPGVFVEADGVPFDGDLMIQGFNTVSIPEPGLSLLFMMAFLMFAGLAFNHTSINAHSLRKKSYLA